jgi:hypothetical protein
VREVLKLALVREPEPVEWDEAAEEAAAAPLCFGRRLFLAAPPDVFSGNKGPDHDPHLFQGL